MASDPANLRALFGPIGQIGYVVHDLESAALEWTRSIGIGPWHLWRTAEFDTVRYNGELVEPRIGVALAFMGDVQVELIQQHDETPSLYREQLDTYGEGAQHICFYPDDYDAALAAAVDSGLRIAQDGAIWGVDFAYLIGDGGRVIELARIDADVRAARARTIERSAAWDGTNPIRHH